LINWIYVPNYLVIVIPEQGNTYYNSVPKM
jgi:hypothetical protein